MTTAAQVTLALLRRGSRTARTIRAALERLSDEEWREVASCLRKHPARRPAAVETPPARPASRRPTVTTQAKQVEDMRAEPVQRPRLSTVEVD